MAEVKPSGTEADFARLMAGEWWSLTGQEQAEAITYATLAGPMVALAWFGKIAEEQPPNSFSGVIPAGAEQFEDGSLIDGARRHGLPNPPFYIRFVVGTVCPDRLEEWRQAWRASPEEVILDPRVYHFSAAFERERCRLMGEEEPPTDAESLVQLMWEQQEEERQLARELFDLVFGGEDREEVGLIETRVEYELQRARVDQITMLIAAATEDFSHME